MANGKKTLPPYVLVNNQALTSSFQSGPSSIETYDRVCLEILCSGTPTGTVSVQGSVDYVPANYSLTPSVSPANWIDLPLSLVALTGAAQNYFIDISQTAIRFIRINYTFSAGTGNMTAVISAKES